MWRCRHCGGEIKFRITIHDDFDYDLKEDGSLGELNVSEGMTVDEYIKENNWYDRVYVCEECGQEANYIDELEEIAYWEE